MKRQRTLDEKVANIQFNITINPPTVFRVTNFSAYKRNKSVFTSDRFSYSSSESLMYVKVYANGNGEGGGTHVSVSIHTTEDLDRSDFMGAPSWFSSIFLSFIGKVVVTIELLNQLEDKNHHIAELEKSSPCPKFISHTELHHPSSENCQFLKHDMLVFRISVDKKKSEAGHS